MHFVYLLKSLKSPQETYIGYTTDIQQRLENHNKRAYFDGRYLDQYVIESYFQ